MSTQSVMPRSWRRPLRKVISVTVVVGILGPLTASLVSSVRQARNAARSADTT